MEKAMPSNLDQVLVFYSWARISSVLLVLSWFEELTLRVQRSRERLLIHEHALFFSAVTQLF